MPLARPSFLFTTTTSSSSSGASPARSDNFQELCKNRKNRRRRALSVNDISQSKQPKLSIKDRRSIKSELTIDCALGKLNDCELMSRIVSTLKSKLATQSFAESGVQVTSKNGFHLMHGVHVEARSKLFVHSLIPNKKDDDIAEVYSADFWELAHREKIGKIIALADPPKRPKYMPPPENATALLALQPIKEGDSRVFRNGIHVQVLKIEQLENIQQMVVDRSENQEAPIAREVTVELTEPATDNHGGDSKKVEVSVDQIFCWSEKDPLEPEISKAIVSRFAQENTQVHCEGGVYRSPAVAVMHQLSIKKDKLTAENVLDEIASEVNRIRCCCHNRQAINTSGLKSIVSLIIHDTDIKINDIPVLTEPVSAPPQSRIRTFDISLSTVTES